MRSLAQISAMLDPTYNLKMQHLQTKIEAEYGLANYKGQLQAQIEHDKQQNARQIEYERRNYDIQKEEKRLETSREIEADKHRHRLELLDVELSQHMKKMEADHHFQKLGRLDAMEHEVFSGAARNMDTRTQLRGEVFKMLAGAIIQEKLAKNQHVRDLEKMRIEHEQKKEIRLWDQLCTYIFELLQNNQKKEAQDYIDKLVKDWEADYK
jgi:hypothetical protein